MSATGSAAMGGMGAATASSVPVITTAFQAVGLGFLLVLPPAFYQTLLIIVLGFTIASSYHSYRLHKNLGPFGLVTAGSLLLYGSIYLIVFEPLYWIAFVLMLLSAGWNYMTAKSFQLNRNLSSTPTVHN